jgi:hypothetical protein
VNSEDKVKKSEDKQDPINDEAKTKSPIDSKGEEPHHLD